MSSRKNMAEVVVVDAAAAGIVRSIKEPGKGKSQANPWGRLDEYPRTHYYSTLFYNSIADEHNKH